ncbi:HAD-IC family P-type ATPase [Lachnoclostridium sp. An138]|uniref:HAD-IC family P-type ATPase n=1 Tax=Lachnoclostridium sp. An138 TaxID=1965560 RepID=UPI001FA8485B
MDELSILNRPSVRIRRDGQDRKADLGELVRGDLMLLESGDQICSDAEIVEGSLEVNESLLTGESDAVVKKKGSGLLSGSFVISGKAYARVTHVGNENYAAKLAAEVKKEKRVHSELLGSMRKVTHFTSFLIVPLGILLFLEAFLLRQASVEEAVVSSAAGLLGMLPKGLVLLISVSLAAGVIRLARMKILVQNIYSLETLAHVDTLCLDKTGTITDGKLQVCGIIPVQAFEGEKMDALICSYMAASDDNNATFQALRQSFSPEAVYEPVHKIPFSSKRKWGSVSFAGKGTIFVGAPEKLMGGLSPRIEQELEKGRRAVAIGWYSGSWENTGELPEEILPLYSVILEDTIRRNAAKTLEFFHTEGVDVKIISGDHVRTVSMIAKRAGLRRWMEAVDMSVQGENPDYDRLCAKYAVFARVTPAQKKELVLALKRQGRQVAMTGDGVNDLLALREADCSIAVADGSDASRQISQIVLLDSDFTNLPQVVMEGRKVIHNVTRTAGVFFIKTIYSVLVSAFCLLFNQPFPFIPIQITLVDACIEAFPSFVTILESDTRRIQGSFLRTALSHALPYGLTVTGMIILMSLTAPFSQAERQTVMYLLLVLISMAAVIRSCIPFTKLRMLICGIMVAGTGCALALFPSLLELQAVTLSMGLFGLSGGALCLLSVLVLDRIRVLFFSENVRMPSEAGWQK